MTLAVGAGDGGDGDAAGVGVEAGTGVGGLLGDEPPPQAAMVSKEATEMIRRIRNSCQETAPSP
jgi:hypothetical protein